ncbi:MAG: PEP-CTERM sorting domain-containing protein [bacterium]
MILRNFLSAVFAAMLLIGSAKAGVVSIIAPGDFSNPTILDFNTAPLGPISSTASLFADFGISSLTATSSGGSDGFQNRNNASRALWFDDGLRIVDPGTSGFDNSMIYTIDFSASHTMFGFGWHDENTKMLVTFFNAGLNVGSVSGRGILEPGGSDNGDLRSLYLMNTESFNRVIISSLTSSDGFALDNLTLDSSTSVTPEPATLTLMALGLGGAALAGRRRKKQKNMKPQLGRRKSDDAYEMAEIGDHRRAIHCFL